MKQFPKWPLKRDRKQTELNKEYSAGEQIHLQCIYGSLGQEAV